MSYRNDLGSLSPDERSRLASLTKSFLTQTVIRKHMDVDHTNQFYTHHRAYIFALETFIKNNTTDPDFLSKVIPLPLWDPKMTLPSSFDTFEGRNAIAPLDWWTPPLPKLPLPPTPPVPGLNPAENLAALRAFRARLASWRDVCRKEILINPPVTDRGLLNIHYSGIDHSNLDNPESFETAEDLAKEMGREVTDGLIYTATHYHGKTHASLAGVFAPYSLDELILYYLPALTTLLGSSPINPATFRIGPFLHMQSTAAPFIFWPLHAFFEQLYYEWEKARVAPVTSMSITTPPGRGMHDLFAVGKGGGLWHSCHHGPDGPNPDDGAFGNWGHWKRIGDRVRKVVASHDGESAQLFIIDTNGNLRRSTFVDSNRGAKELWAEWQLVHDSHWKDLAVIRRSNGRHDLFALLMDDSVWFRRERSDGSFEVVDQIGTGTSHLSALLDGDGPDARAHVFWLTGGRAWHRWELTAGGAMNGPTEFMLPTPPHDLTQMEAARNADDRLEVFALGFNGQLYHSWQTTAGANTGFTPWVELDGFPSRSLAVGRNKDGRLEVFFGAGADLFHRWQVVPNGSWSSRSRLPLDRPIESLGSLQLVNDVEGRMTVYGVGQDGLLWHAFQKKASQGPWLGWMVI